MPTKQEILKKFADLSKNDQIEVVLNGFMDRRVMQKEGDQIMLIETASCFSVTPEDIWQYVKEKFEPFIYEKESDEEKNSDGYHFVEVDGKYHLITKERGIKFEDLVFDTYEEAFKLMIKRKIDNYLHMKKAYQDGDY